MTDSDDLIFNHKTTLKQKIIKTKDPVIFKCLICDYTSKYKQQLMVHEWKHTSFKPYKCLLCEYSTTTYYLLRKHEKNHKELKCKWCDYKTQFKQTLQTHTATTHFKNFSGSYSKSTCNEKVVQTDESVHSEEPRFRCIFCSYASTNASSLIQHQKMHSDRQSKNYLKHMSIMHAKEKLFPCSSCNQSFKRKDLLTQHQMIHTNNEPIKCSLCTLKFRQQADLVRHKKIHSSVKEYKYSQHALSGKSNDLLPIHQSMEYNSFLCTWCNFNFKCKINLDKHVRKVHGFIIMDYKPPQVERFFKCTFCLSNFKMKAQLDVHQALHNETPFLCLWCNYCCTDEHQLQLHQKSHIKVKLFKCSICSLSFREMSTLKIHKRTHMNEVWHSQLKNACISKCNIFQRKTQFAHSGERKYQCSCCSHVSVQKEDLIKHEKKIHGKVKRPYKSLVDLGL